VATTEGAAVSTARAKSEPTIPTAPPATDDDEAHGEDREQERWPERPCDIVDREAVAQHRHQEDHPRDRSAQTQGEDGGGGGEPVEGERQEELQAGVVAHREREDRGSVGRGA
jgi:hypothetical protein